MDIPAIQIPSKKDMWLNLDSEKSIISWYNVLKNRHECKHKHKHKKSKKNTSVMYENKTWRQLFFDFDR